MNYKDMTDQEFRDHMKKVNAHKFKDCPECGASHKKQELRNHSVIWGDGEVHCGECGVFLRHWDSG